MLEIRFHGRGGQGAVLASEILAKSLLLEGKSVQCMPKFGVERRGAPIEAFLRVDDKKIFLRSQIYSPDCVVIFGSSLIKAAKATRGLKNGGILIINTPKPPSDFKELGEFKIATVDATKIALECGIGTKTQPIVNTVILGAVARVLGFSLDSIARVIRVKIKAAEANVQGLKVAYENTVLLQDSEVSNEQN